MIGDVAAGVGVVSAVAVAAKKPEKAEITNVEKVVTKRGRTK